MSQTIEINGKRYSVDEIVEKCNGVEKDKDPNTILGSNTKILYNGEIYKPVIFSIAGEKNYYLLFMTIRKDRPDTPLYLASAIKEKSTFGDLLQVVPYSERSYISMVL